MKYACTEAAKSALGLAHTLKLSEDTTKPVVFLVHGRAGNASVMWPFARCIPENFSIVAPEAPLHDSLGGFSWWNIEHQDRDEQILSAIQKLTHFIDHVSRFYSLNPSKIIAFGFSQGAGLLSTILQRNPAFFSGVALLAGFVLKPHHSENFQFRSSTPLPPVFIAHGISDDVVPIDKARQGRDYLSSRGFSVEMFEDPVGHKVGTSGMKALRQWMTQFEA